MDDMGQGVAGIFATVRIDTTDVPTQLDALRAILAATDTQFDKLASTANESMREIEQATTREVEHNLKERHREERESEAAVKREVEHNLREREREANERAAIIARTLAAELAADRTAQQSRNAALAADIQARHDLAEAQRFAPGREGLSDRQATNQAIQAQAQYNDLMGKGAKGARNYSYAMMQLGYSIDDAQYGIIGLGNNVMTLGSAFGATSPMLVGALAGITAAAVVYRNWNTIVQTGRNILYAGIPITKSHAEQMEELGKITHRTADEQARYNALKEEQGRIESVLAIEGETVRSQKEGVTKAIERAHGGKKVIGQLAGAMGREHPGLGADTEAEEAVKSAQSYVDFATKRLKDDPDHPIAIQNLQIAKRQLGEAQDKARKARDANLQEMAKELIADSLVDPEKLKTLIGYAGKHKDSFAKGFAGELGMATPEAIAQREEREGTIGDDPQENERRAAKSKQKRKDDKTKAEHEASKSVSETADDLYKATLVNMSKGIRIDRQSIQKSLEDAAGGPVDPAFADKVAAALIKKWGEEVGRRAIQMGGNRPAAEQALIAEAAGRQANADRRDAAPSPEEREAETKRNKRITQGRKALGYTPSIVKALKDQARRKRDPDQTDDQLYRSFREQLDPHMTIDEADEAASAHVKMYRDKIETEARNKARYEGAFRDPRLRMSPGPGAAGNAALKQGGNPPTPAPQASNDQSAVVDVLGKILTAINTPEQRGADWA